MSSEAMLELTTKAESIDPASIGLQSGPYTDLTPVDIRAIEQQVRILTAAQALLQVINTTPSGLVLRDPYVQYDFLSPASGGIKITSGDWRQPAVDGSSSLFYSTATGDITAAPVSVYITGFTSKYNMKVITIYGFEVVGTGNDRGGKCICINTILLKRGNVKLIDIIDIQGLSTGSPPRKILRTPVMYKAADDGNVLFTPDYATPADANKFDRIKPICVVCESLGASQTG